MLPPQFPPQDPPHQPGFIRGDSRLDAPHRLAFVLVILPRPLLALPVAVAGEVASRALQHRWRPRHLVDKICKKKNCFCQDVVIKRLR